MRTGAEVLVLTGHTGVQWSASFSPDGFRIVTVCEDKTAKVWDATPIGRALEERDPALLRETVK